MEEILNKEIVSNKVVCRVLGVAVFVALTALGAFVRIPLGFTPVPLTLQTFFVLLSGLFLGRRLGATSQLSYISLGLLGVPIFTGAGSGLIYLAGPTGGYLLGFVLAAFWVGGFIKYNRNNFYLTFLILCIADMILLACGAIWLKIIFGYSVGKSLFIGFIPFIPGDLLKISVAAVIYSKLKPRIEELF